MKKLKMISSILMLIVILSITGCKKETVQGPSGATGPQGQQGVPGNANVRSTTFTVPVSGWIVNNPVYYADIPCSSITSDIINTGAVLVYLQTQASPAAFGQLPVTLYPANNYSRTYEVYSKVGIVEIHLVDSDLTQSVAPTVPVTFKIVVVASSLLQANPNLDLSNYSKVMAAFNVSE